MSVIENPGEPSAVDEAQPVVSRTTSAGAGITHQNQRQITEATLAKALLVNLFDESHAAKIVKVAQDYLTGDEYPEHVPDGSSKYLTKPRTVIKKFWTCGFLPGCLYAVLERRIRFPRFFPVPLAAQPSVNGQLLDLCRSWNAALLENANRKDTHDLGFMTIALRRDYELTANESSRDAVVKAAYNLASRYSERTKCIRSWDVSVSNAYNITGFHDNFLIIIDSMCNMDLLYYVAHITGDASLSEKATAHARKLLSTHIRPDNSTYHCANLDPATGAIKYHYSHQGYMEHSCWSRGQAWALLGYVQTYSWTNDPIFLDAAMSIANYFCQRLSRLNHEAPYVPPWDFDAPIEDGQPVLRDTSAGMIAANGLLLLHQTLQGQSPFLEAVMRIIEDTLAYSLAADRAHFGVDDQNQLTVDSVDFPAILRHSTANNNENASVRYSDHGLIYADYYFLELGNKLLRMGLL